MFALPHITRHRRTVVGVILHALSQFVKGAQRSVSAAGRDRSLAVNFIRVHLDWRFGAKQLSCQPETSGKGTKEKPFQSELLLSVFIRVHQWRL
jgi:hypothetical protein